MSDGGFGSINTGFRPPTTQSFSGQLPVRFDGNPKGPLGAETKWRGCKDLEESTILRTFGLDPIRFYVDLPSSARGIGSSRGSHSSAARIINGFIFMRGVDEPVAKLTVVREGDKFKDVDPRDRREWADLSHS